MGQGLLMKSSSSVGSIMYNCDTKPYVILYALSQAQNSSVLPVNGLFNSLSTSDREFINLQWHFQQTTGSNTGKHQQQWQPEATAGLHQQQWQQEATLANISNCGNRRQHWQTSATVATESNSDIISSMKFQGSFLLFCAYIYIQL